MITGIDYILYTRNKQDVFIQKMKDSLPFWDNSYYVIEQKTKQLTFLLRKTKRCFNLWMKKDIIQQEAPAKVLFWSCSTASMLPIAIG